MPNTFAALDCFIQHFNARLSTYLDVNEPKVDSKISMLYPIMKAFTLSGGKRIRPALLYFTSQCFQCEDMDTALLVSLSAELMQASLLIHDDIMDEADLRRGEPTVHKRISQAHPEMSVRETESMAILLGNIACQMGIQIIHDSKLLDAQKMAMIKLYNQVVIDTCYGQALDMIPCSGLKVSKETIYRIYRDKTALYSMVYPMVCAGIISGKDQTTLDALSQSGEALGLAFQAHDDILGVFSSEAEVGKSTISDIAQGKKTLLLAESLARVNPVQQAVIKSKYGFANISVAEADEVKQIMTETGAKHAVEKWCVQQTEHASEILSTLALDEKDKSSLWQLIDYVTKRKN